MASFTEPTKQHSSQATQTSPPASKLSRTLTTNSRRTAHQIRQSSASTALSCFLGLLFFTLIIHACIRSISNSKPKHRSDNDGPVLGAMFSFIPVIFTIVGIVTSLEDISTGLAGQAIVSAMTAAVAGLAWVVFGVGNEAKFPTYLAWVMWPVVGVYGIVVLGAWGWVVRSVEVIEDEGKGDVGKGEKSDQMPYQSMSSQVLDVASY